MPENKKESMNKSIEILYKKMKQLDIEDSFGILILSTGMALKVNKYFEYLLDNWSDYKLAKATNNQKTLDKILKQTGGILTNGEISIDIDSVMGMISVPQYEELAETQSPIDDYLPFLDYEGQGDSKSIPFNS
jgi:hypothetical protein